MLVLPLRVKAVVGMMHLWELNLFGDGLFALWELNFFGDGLLCCGS